MVEPSRAGLTIMGAPRAAKAARGIGHTGHHAPVRRGQAFKAPDALGHDFVHGHARSHHAGAGVGNAQQLQRSLHRAVFTEAAMQGDKAAGKALGFQARTGLARRDRMRGHPPLAHARRPARPCPDIRETSRSDERPPISTATLPKAAAWIIFHCFVLITQSNMRLQLVFSSSSTTLAGTAPIDPAPMVSTTSPGRALSTMARGKSGNVRYK